MIIRVLTLTILGMLTVSALAVSNVEDCIKFLARAVLRLLVLHHGK
jgi:hypothetical protein